MNRRSHITLCFALAIALVLALFIPGPATMAQGDDKPSVTVSDQETDGTLVSVDSVVASENGWMVIHADANGKPGSVSGKTAVPAGMTENVIVVLDEPLTDTATLWAMLHVDKGEVGTYEFPDGPDVPASDGSAIVLAPFVASVPAAEVAMEEEPAEEVVAEEAMEEEAAVEAMPEETMAEDMPAPEQLPDTGSRPIGVATSISVVLLMVVVLAGGLVVNRKRRA